VAFKKWREIMASNKDRLNQTKIGDFMKRNRGNLMLIMLIITFGFLLGISLHGQQTVTTTGGTANQVSKFSGSSTVINSAITENNGNVGIGTTNPTQPLQVNGSILLTGQTTQQITVQGNSSGRFGQDSIGTFLSSDSAGNTLRFFTNNGAGINDWMQIDSNGKATFSDNQNGADFGEVAIAPDNKDVISAYEGQAGRQMHFRLSRAYCDKRTGSQQSQSDQQNFFCVPDAVTIDDNHPPSSTPNKNFVIVPYWYGINMDYPGGIEINSKWLGAHNNHTNCSPSTTNWLDFSSSCQAGGQFWAEDSTDAGGVFLSSYDTIVNGQFDRSQSFVLIASDQYSHNSHGDMLFAVRDANDNFRFQFGASGTGGADAPSTYKQFTKARIDSTGKGFFDGGTQTGGADFAESISVTGAKMSYEPGDVLVIDAMSDRQVALSREPYSTLVAGVYSTKPGVVGTLHGSEDPTLIHEIPMAIIGIVPCKVSAENGPISRGDLLVTSSTPGYAMRGTDSRKLTGAIIGKALQPLPAGKGEIEVLMTLR
jgi:hypothetical protein